MVRIEATPLNPSDRGLLLSAADPASFAVTASGDQPVTTGTIPAALVRFVAARKGKPMPVGNEAAGTVVKAGESAEAQVLLGKTVAITGGAMYTQNRLFKARDCLVLPEGATAEQGASSLVHPMTALSMVSVLRRAGEKALVHTAAASNLGQMLVKLCQAEGIPLVNIVRSEEQVVSIYGRLDNSPTQLAGGFGFAWGVGGWLLTPCLQPLAAEEVAAMRRRGAENLHTIFASHYTRRITQQEALRLSSSSPTASAQQARNI